MVRLLPQRVESTGFGETIFCAKLTLREALMRSTKIVFFYKDYRRYFLRDFHALFKKYRPVLFVKHTIFVDFLPRIGYRDLVSNAGAK